MVFLLLGELLFGLRGGEGFGSFFDKFAPLGDGAAVVTHGVAMCGRGAEEREVLVVAEAQGWRGGVVVKAGASCGVEAPEVD